MGMRPKKMHEILRTGQEPASLETPIGDEDDSQFGDLIEDRDAVEPLEAVGEILQKEELGKVLAPSPTASAGSLSCASVLIGGHPRTLEEVGEKFGVTRERIRQIEAKTLAKLRSYRECQRLRDCLD